jgi:hypothetical protein
VNVVLARSTPANITSYSSWQFYKNTTGTPAWETGPPVTPAGADDLVVVANNATPVFSVHATSGSDTVYLLVQQLSGNLPKHLVVRVSHRNAKQWDNFDPLPEESDANTCVMNVNEPGPNVSGEPFDPSCIGRKMVDTAVHLEQHVLPAVPIRHWICSLPWGLRSLLGYDKKLCAQVVSAFVGELSRSLKHRAKQALVLDSVRQAFTGAVASISRTDSALRLNVHFHVLALDGVYVREDEGGPLVFYPLPTPTSCSSRMT